METKRFEFRGGVQHLFQFGPMLSKRIGARAVAAWLLEFAGQLASLLILGYCFSACNVRFDGRLFLSAALGSFSHG